MEHTQAKGLGDRKERMRRVQDYFRMLDPKWNLGTVKGMPAWYVVFCVLAVVMLVTSLIDFDAGFGLAVSACMMDNLYILLSKPSNPNTNKEIKSFAVQAEYLRTVTKYDRVLSTLPMKPADWLELTFKRWWIVSGILFSVRNGILAVTLLLGSGSIRDSAVLVLCFAALVPIYMVFYELSSVYPGKAIAKAGGVFACLISPLLAILIICDILSRNFGNSRPSFQVAEAMRTPLALLVLVIPALLFVLFYMLLRHGINHRKQVSWCLDARKEK